MTTRINRKNLVTIISAAILVGTEILGAALAFGWAMGSLYQLGDMAKDVLIGLCLIGGTYGIWKFVKGAIKIEPIRE
jgi:hypothetical protein